MGKSVEWRVKSEEGLSAALEDLGASLADAGEDLNAALADDGGSYNCLDGAVLDIAPGDLGDAGDPGAVSDEYGVSTVDHTDEG